MRVVTVSMSRKIPLALVALALVATSCSAITGADLTTTEPESSPPSSDGATPTTLPSTPGLAIVPEGGAPIYASPGGAVVQTIHEAIVLPITATDGLWAEVVDSCSNPMWVKQADVEIAPRNLVQQAGPGPAFDLNEAVVIVDAGHGGRDWGAPGPNGTRESHFNLDIADRLRDLLLSSNDIDWDTGVISPGAGYPAIEGAYMTRDTSGPDEGDFEAGLAYRAIMANSVAADALLAIHNNTGTDRTLNDPPRSIFYAMSVEGSGRLASLIDEELWRGFDPFSETWQGSGIQGTASRMDVSTGTDFYGLLRRSEVPAVIIEGAYITDPTQEALLQTEEFRQAYAEGVYRGLVRFLTTDEVGTEIREPVAFQGNVGSPSTDNCVVPSQSTDG